MAKNVKLADYWLAEFSLGGQSHHLMILQGTGNKGHIEAGFNRMAEIHADAYPHLAMKLERLEKMESPEQVEKAKERIREKYPMQLTADEMNPGNPNALLFPPLDPNQVIDMAGRAEEEIIRNMCDGRFNF